MQQTTVRIENEVGLHARPAAQFVKLAKQHKSNITVACNGKTVSAKSLVLLLSLGAEKGSELAISAEGEDEEQAVQALTTLIQKNFSE
ncbi:MAG TPA: HPr family phosphocarrier protein [Dictyobacter sp.]|jgi:phosphocarrier protein|nr:HPr family phosphocarrier protein [Dictyobacter sp.]